MKAATTSRLHSEMPAASRQRSASRRSISSSRRSIRDGREGMAWRVESESDGRATLAEMARRLPFGPAPGPSRVRAEGGMDALLERGYTACEIDFAGRFWMDYDFAARFGALARENDIVLSVHAPIAGFMGHAERGKKLNM